VAKRKLKRSRNRPGLRKRLFPKKVLKEQMGWDIVFFRMKQSIEAAFPDPDERLQYIVNLIRGLEDDSEKPN